MPWIEPDSSHPGSNINTMSPERFALYPRITLPFCLAAEIYTWWLYYPDDWRTDVPDHVCMVQGQEDQEPLY